MITNHDDRVVTTPILLDLVQRGIDHEFNRCLDVGKLQKVIDPDGIHLLHVVLGFHEQYRPNVDHHRVWVYIKEVGTGIPIQGLMDIADSDWNQLATYAEFQAAANTP